MLCPKQRSRDPCQVPYWWEGGNATLFFSSTHKKRNGLSVTAHRCLPQGRRSSSSVLKSTVLRRAVFLQQYMFETCSVQKKLDFEKGTPSYPLANIDSTGKWLDKLKPVPPFFSQLSDKEPYQSFAADARTTTGPTCVLRAMCDGRQNLLPCICKRCSQHRLVFLRLLDI